MLFVALARPELVDARPSWGGGAAAQTRIALEPLATDVAVEMAVGLLPHAEGDTIKRLVDVAEGNPLFIEELAAAVEEQAAADTLPVTVRAVIAARVDSLPPDARSALLSAAVVGRTFWQDVLRAVSGIPDLDELLEDLERRDLIRREPTSRLEGDIEFRFKHALIRDVAYGTLPRATRRERHAATAQFVEERTDGAESLAWVLAHHWREAGQPEKAIPYLLAAAALAQQSWATDAVVDLYSQAIELETDAASRARLRLLRGMALVMLSAYAAALEDLEAVLDELEGADLLDGLLYLGRSYVWTEQDQQTIETAQRALELAIELGDTDGEVAATALLSDGLAMRGDAGDIDRAVELGDDALRRWRSGRRDFERANHSHLHGNLMYWLGDYERAVELGMAAHRLGGEVHNTEAVLRGGGLGAMALAELGRHEEALARLGAMIDVAVEFGSKPMYLLNYLSLVHRELNDLSVAREHSEQALEIAGSVSFGMPRRFARSDLLMTSLLEGDIGRAQADWPGLWEDAEHATAWTKWLIYGRLAASRAEIALHAETPELAIEWSHKAIETATSTRRRKYEAIARSILGEALALQGQRDAALSELETAVRIADELIGEPARFNSRAALARAAYALGDDDRASTANAEGRALVDDFVATLAPERADLVRASPVVQELFATP